MANNTHLPFTPVRGLEEHILQTPWHNGQVYFSTDTKKIFMDYGTIEYPYNKIPMGGNSGFYYGKKNIGDETPEGQVDFEFALEEIENAENNKPNIDDLILNIPDGCFYRVISYEGAVVLAKKLTIAGSGGGGGSSSDPVGAVTLSYAEGQSRYMTYRYGQTIYLVCNIAAADADNNATGTCSYQLFSNGALQESGYIEQGVQRFDVTKYTALGKTAFSLIVTGDIGGIDQSKTLRWDISTTQFDLTWNYDTTQINNLTNDFTLEWQVSGQNISKSTYIYIDGICINSTNPIVTTSSVGQVYTLKNLATEYALTHGAHVIGLQATANIGGTDMQTLRISHIIMFEDISSAVPIISIGLLEDKLTQYNTVKIPIICYKQSNTLGDMVVNLYENGQLIDSWENVQNQEVNYWSYTPTIAGLVSLSVRVDSTEVSKAIEVEALDIDNEEVPGYSFKFKPADFASNNAIQTWGKEELVVVGNNNKVFTDINATFSNNFDWNNGGIDTDESGMVLFRVKAGTAMTINYPLFFKAPNQTGKCFKFIFKASKCRNFDAQILSCVDDGERGLKMRAQDAAYKSLSSSLNIPYCEDSYIEFELDITKVHSKLKHYIKAWLDGVPCGLVNFAEGDSFTHFDPIGITIGSADCDVEIYLLKVYEKHLTDEEHLKNFIADVNADEMLQRYQRNDILDERNEISPTLLAEKNPDCMVHVYNIPRMTTSKKDTVGINDEDPKEEDRVTYTLYQGSAQAIMSSQDVRVKVQGTSSAKYGLAAFNLDSKFKDFYNVRTGETTKKWSLDTGMIPVNYFTTKVNVASCENANNALNQEWYNRYQPYKTLARCKNPQARDTMEFKPGVVFLIDRNTKTDGVKDDAINNNVFAEIAGYTTSPYAKLYSICNMGNSKKNVEVIHDTTNPLECCIEVTDNQAAQQMMISDAFTENDINGGEEYFEFRYPDEDEFDYGPMKRQWMRFVQWMARSNPQPKYIEHKISSEEEFIAIGKKKVVVGKDEETGEDIVEYVNIDVYYVDPVDEKHKVITDYDPDITLYYNTSDNIYGYTNEPLPQAVHFDPYTFRGYKADEELQKDYTPIVKGLTISTYATGIINYYRIPVTINTEAAFNKALSDYTEVYMLIDVVNSEEAQYIQVNSWEEALSYNSIDFYYKEEKPDYTHDTYEYRMAKMLSECEDYLVMDSIIYHYLMIERHTMLDNVAKNTFWSTEDGLHWDLTRDYDNDTADGNDNNGHLTRSYGAEVLDKQEDGITYVFNARESVWLNFIHGLPEACQTVYQALDNKGAWSATNYLKLFKDWQSTIPERVWIESYYRTYIRPFEIYDEAMYIPMLEGGKKTYQRKQFETYQNSYISSKYQGKDALSSSILIRGNGSGKLGAPLPVKMYADCYILAAIGSGNTPNISIRAKKDKVYNISCPRNNLNNTTFYMYPSGLYSEIGSEVVNEGQLGDFLPEQLSMNGASKLRKLILGIEEQSEPNEKLVSVDFQSNDLLETLYAAKCTKISQGLNLSSAPNLKYLNAIDSSFTAVSLANNAPIETIKLQNPTSLKLSNLNALQSIEIKDYSRLLSIDLTNIDTLVSHSQNIVENLIGSNVQASKPQYNLHDILWNLDETADLTNDNIPKITLLEKLLTKCQPLEDFTTGNSQLIQASLSGLINIDETAYDGIKTFEIQDQYIQNDTYPNLDIDFEGGTALYNIVIYSSVKESNQIAWKRKARIGTKITQELLSSGPYGAFTTDKIISPVTEQYIYNFSGNYEVYADEEKINLIGTITDESQLPLYNQVITQNLYIVPLFGQAERTYTISFYNNTTLIDTKYQVPYGIQIKDILPDIIPEYELAGELPDLGWYDFVGYSLVNGGTPIATDQIVRQDWSLYASYNYVSDVRTVVHEDWFTYTLFTVRDTVNSIYPDLLVGKQGYEIAPKYAKMPSKFTIPSTYNGLPVYQIGSSAFKDRTEITHVYCAENSNLRYLNNYTFDGCLNLKIFDFSQNTIVSLGNYCFRLCEQLQYTGLSQKLTEIGDRCFNQAFTSEEPVIFEVPAQVIKIKYLAFSYMKLAAGSTINIGAFNQASKWEPVSVLQDGATVSGPASCLVFPSNPISGTQTAMYSYNYYTNAYKTVEDPINIATESGGQIVLRDLFTTQYITANISIIGVGG